MGTDFTLDAAAALQNEKTAERMRLIQQLHKATQTAIQLHELLTTAKQVRKAAPPGLVEPLDEVVEAAKRADAVAEGSRATAWKDATAGGWAARELRQLGIAPVRARREKPADGDAPGPSASGDPGAGEPAAVPGEA